MLKPFATFARGLAGVAAVAAVFSFSPLTAADGDNTGPGPGPTPGATPDGQPDMMAAMRAQMGGPITEAKYAILMKLQGPMSIFDGKLNNAKDDAAKAEIETQRQAAFKEAGMDEVEYTKLNKQLQGITMFLLVASSPEHKADAAKADAALKMMFDPISIATVKAHQDATPAATPGTTPGATTGTTPGADGGKPAAAAAETDVDPAKLAGTWVIDLDATLEMIRPNMSVDMKNTMKNMMKSQPHPDRFSIGPGEKSAMMQSNPDGTTTTETGTWSFADGKLTIKHDDKTQKDTVLDCKMRGDELLCGPAGKGRAVFKKKAE